MNEILVYARIDDQSRIVAVNSSAFLTEEEVSTGGWSKIDSGIGDQFYHAQGNYFPKLLFDDRGIPRYKLEDGKGVERSQEEMDADYAEPEAKPTLESRVETVENKSLELEETLDMILSGVTSDE